MEKSLSKSHEENHAKAGSSDDLITSNEMVRAISASDVFDACFICSTRRVETKLQKKRYTNCTFTRV
ncbi:MAG: hypothetical protein R6U13_14820 [Desulfatiglandaceae bacterium]